MRRGMLCAAIAVLPIVLSASPAAAIPLVTPSLFPGQKDGVFVTNRSTIVEFIDLQETNDGFFAHAFKKPTGFKSATVYLTEPGTTRCTPDPAKFSLGTCSDGLTIQSDLANKRIDISFVSVDSDLTQRKQFFAGLPGQFRGVSTTVDFVPETGLWQDVSTFFGQRPGFALVQSDPLPTPEPVSLALFGTGLVAMAIHRRRRSNGFG